MRENKFTSIRLEITSKCNINCKYCHNSDYANKSDDMKTEEILALIKNLKKDYPINKILITGGEPTTDKDLIQIVKYITSLGIKADMVTNGKLLTKEVIKNLEVAGLKRIRLSIDGFDEHKYFRDGSDSNRLWDLCSFMKKETNLNVVVHTVCWSHNVNTLKEIYKKIVELKIDRWRVFDIGYSGSAVKNFKEFNVTTYYNNLFNQVVSIIEDYIENKRQETLNMEINGIFRSELLSVTEEDFPKNKNEVLLSDTLKNSPCDYVSQQLTIRSNGLGTMCQFYHNTIFNFKDNDFDIKKAEETMKSPDEYTLLINEIKHCKDCKYILLCNSGCRSKAEFFTGNIRNPDPVFCVYMPLIYTKIIPLFNKTAQNAFLNVLHGDKEPFYNDGDLHRFIEKQL